MAVMISKSCTNRYTKVNSKEFLAMKNLEKIQVAKESFIYFQTVILYKMGKIKIKTFL